LHNGGQQAQVPLPDMPTKSSC